MMATLIAEKFEVLGELGRGGMGAVYKVRDTRSDTLLAVKVLHQDFMADPELVKRFYGEAHVVARLTSPPISMMIGTASPAGVPSCGITTTW